MLRALAKGSPGRQAVAGDVPLLAGLLEGCHGGAQAALEGRPIDEAELLFGVVQVEDIDGLQPEIDATPGNLVPQECGSDAVSLVDDLVACELQALHVLLAQVPVRILRQLSVERQVAGFGRDDELTPPGRIITGGAQRRADAPLATLMAVVDRRVDEVAPELNGSNDGAAVGDIGVAGRGPQVGANADRRDLETMGFAEVLRTSDVLETPGVLGRRGRRSAARKGGGWVGRGQGR